MASALNKNPRVHSFVGPQSRRGFAFWRKSKEDSQDDRIVPNAPKPDRVDIDRPPTLSFLDDEKEQKKPSKVAEPEIGNSTEPTMPGSTSVKSTQPNRYVSLDERDQREQELFEKREAKLNIIGQETSESAQTEAQLKGEISPGMKKFLSEMYGLLMAASVTSVVGATIGSLSPIAGGVIGVAYSVAIFTMPAVAATVYLVLKSGQLYHQSILPMSGLALGAMIAPTIALVAPGVAISAALGTVAIFMGFTAAALNAKRRSMVFLGGPLFGSMVIVAVAGLLHLFHPILGITNPLFLSDAMREYEKGCRDPTLPAFNMFLNLLNLFLRILAILAKKGKK